MYFRKRWLVNSEGSQEIGSQTQSGHINSCSPNRYLSHCRLKWHFKVKSEATCICSILLKGPCFSAQLSNCPFLYSYVWLVSLHSHSFSCTNHALPSIILVFLSTSMRILRAPVVKFYLIPNSQPVILENLILNAFWLKHCPCDEREREDLIPFQTLCSVALCLSWYRSKMPCGQNGLCWHLKHLWRKHTVPV